MNQKRKRITIKLDPKDHRNLKITSAKEGLFIKEKVENLIENYIYSDIRFEPDVFEKKQINI